MTHTNITNLREHLFEYINQVVEYNDIININTKNGNAIILSEEDYNALMETLYLSGSPRTKQEIIEGLHTSSSECISEDEVEW